MGVILSLFLGVIPAFIYAAFVYWLDRYEKEPVLLFLLKPVLKLFLFEASFLLQRTQQQQPRQSLSSLLLLLLKNQHAPEYLSG